MAAALPFSAEPRRRARHPFPQSPLANTVYTIPASMQPHPSPSFFPAYPSYNATLAASAHPENPVAPLASIVAPSVDPYPPQPEPLVLADSAYTQLHPSHHVSVQRQLPAAPLPQQPREPASAPYYESSSFSPLSHPPLVDPPATDVLPMGSYAADQAQLHTPRSRQHIPQQLHQQLQQRLSHQPHSDALRAASRQTHVQQASASSTPHRQLQHTPLQQAPLSQLQPHARKHPSPKLQGQPQPLSFAPSEVAALPPVDDANSSQLSYLPASLGAGPMYPEPSVLQPQFSPPASALRRDAQQLAPTYAQPSAPLAPLQQPTVFSVPNLQSTPFASSQHNNQSLGHNLGDDAATAPSFVPVAQQPATLLLNPVQPHDHPIPQTLTPAADMSLQPIVPQPQVSAGPIMPMQDMLGTCQYSVPVEMMESYLAVGVACRDLGRLDLAADSFRACVAICPESTEARNGFAAAMYGQGVFDMSMNDFASALDLGPVFAEDVFNDVGNALRAMGRTTEAEMAYRSALNIAPRHAHAWNNLGNAMRARGAVLDAMQCYSASLSCQPGFAAAHCNLAGLLRDQGKPQEAEAQYRAALLSDPNLAEAAAGLGTALRDMGRTEEAVAFYVRAVTLQPDAADHHANLANTYKDLNRIEESIVSYEAALSIQPDLPDAFCNMVHSLSVICDWRNRSQNFATLLTIIDRQLDALLHNSATNPRLYNTLAGALSNSTPQLVDVCGGSRSDRDGASVSATTSREENSMDPCRRKFTHHPSSPTVVKKARLRGKFAKFVTSTPAVVAPVLTCGLPSVQPFHALIYPMTPEKFRALSAAYASRAEQMVNGVARAHQRWTLPRGPRARLKVGYVSSDYNNHPYSHLTQSIYGLHGNGSTVECFCYALTPSDNSAWRLRIEREAEHFRDISAMTAKQSADAIAKDGIHVLVNCNGYTKGARTELFALRPAPVQVSFMGFPGTLGAHYIEYFITDVVTSPPSLASRMHSEALLYHPHSYFVNDHRQTSIPGPAAYPSGTLTRAHYRLPEDCFLFIMHNQLYKLSPDTFDVWARILKRVPNSKIWLLRFPPTGEQRIRAEAAKRGLSADRLVFTDVAGKEEHVARAGLGDLFLDTPTCNAHTTGTDVLWSGVPMITCPGSLFASRVAASLLTAAGVPELIAADMNEYEDLAVELATNRPRLAAIRAKIEATRYTNALFDTERWVRNVEALYWRAWKNFEAGREPTHIFGQDVYDGSTMVSRPAAIESMYSGTDSRRSETLMYGKVYSSTVAT